MSVSGSGLFVATFQDVLDTTQLAIDLDLETHKIALFSNSITPDFTNDTAYGSSPYDANEVTGTNWSAGGVVLTGTGLSKSGGVLTFDATDISVASTTLTGARAGLLYADALAGNNAILLVDFGADYDTSNGTFEIAWNASGIFTWDMVP